MEKHSKLPSIDDLTYAASESSEKQNDISIDYAINLELIIMKRSICLKGDLVLEGSKFNERMLIAIQTRKNQINRKPSNQYFLKSKKCKENETMTNTQPLKSQFQYYKLTIQWAKISFTLVKSLYTACGMYTCIFQPPNSLYHQEDQYKQKLLTKSSKTQEEQQLLQKHQEQTSKEQGLDFTASADAKEQNLADNRFSSLSYSNNYGLLLTLIIIMFQSIGEELVRLRKGNNQSTASINFTKIIAKQKEVIQSLQDQILLLKSYISIHCYEYSKEQIVSKIQPVSQSIVNQLSIMKENNLLNDQKICKYKSILQAIRYQFELPASKNEEHSDIIHCIKNNKEELRKKKEPIFVQKIKEIKVPITIQKIIQKPVQKIIERIVYVDRPTVVFKEKVVEKFIEIDEPLNKSFSQKTLKMPKYDRDYDNQRYDRKPSPGDFYRKQQTGTPLNKKRQSIGNFRPTSYYSKK